MSTDWLDTDERVPALPIPVELPAGYAERAALAEASWGRLSPKQKTFLSAYRDCRFNERAACRQLGFSVNTKPNTGWMQEADYALVVRVWRANAAVSALDKDRLLARHDDIAETALTPKPVLHQGIPVLVDGKILEEVDVGAARSANADLMQAAGILKSGKDVEVNVGISVGPPTLNIQVMPAPPSKVVARESVVIDAQFTQVPDDESWLG